LLTKLKGSDFTGYRNDLKDLFTCTSETSYNKLLNERQKAWDKEFTDYYMKNIHTEISSIGRWGLEKMVIYQPYTGVINNYSENINRHAAKYNKMLHINMCTFIYLG